MDSNYKIDLINAYRKLLDTKKIPKVDPDDIRSVDTEITEAFETWAKGQLSSLLGEENTSSLSKEEVLFLKKFVATAQQRAAAPSAPATPPVVQSIPGAPKRITTEVPLSSEPKPLKEKSAKAPAGSLLAELDRMDERASRKNDY